MKKKGQLLLPARVKRSFPYIIAGGLLVYCLLAYTNFVINFKSLGLIFIPSFWLIYLYLLTNSKLSKKDKRELKITTIYLAIFTAVLIYRFISPLPIILASTPSPNPPSVTDSPDPQQGGSAITFSCSSCSSGAAGEYMKLLICKSNTDACVLGSQWSYRRLITIDNTQNSNTLTDYQVLVTVDTASLISAGKMRSDCGDIRFTDSDGTTLLNYWLESGCNSASTKIWVKVPSIPASSTKTIYMYYGNPDASSASDGTATFLFYDDMETWTGWTQYGSGQVSQDSTRAYEGSYSAHKTTANDPNGAYKPLPTALGRDIIVEVWCNRNSAYAGGSWDRVGVIDDSGNGYGSGASPADTDDTADYLIDVRNAYSGTVTYISGTHAGTDVWYQQKLFILSDGTIRAEFYDANGNLLASGSITDTSYSSFTNFYIFGGYDYWVDLVRIRKYTDPEPTASIGAEETNTASDYIWAQSAAVESNPSASYTCPSCTYSTNTYYGVSYNINETVWTSFTGAQTFTCKKKNTCYCSSNVQCYSGACKTDPDGSGAFCCDSYQCAHDGVCSSIVELVNAPGGNACIEGENIAHNSAGTQHPRYAAYDGQLYYCGTSSGDKSPYSQVTNLVPTDRIGKCQCKFDGNFDCSQIITIRGGRVRIVP